MGFIIGFVIAILLIFYHLFSLQTHIRHDLLLSIGGWLMIMGVIIGGVASGFIIDNYFICKLTKKGGIWGCISGSILIAPLSLYIGIIFASIGGGIGESIGRRTEIGQVGAYIGIFIGIIFFIIIIEVIGALIGTGLGFLRKK